MGTIYFMSGDVRLALAGVSRDLTNLREMHDPDSDEAALTTAYIDGMERVLSALDESQPEDD